MKVFEKGSLGGYWSGKKLTEIIDEVFNSCVDDKEVLKIMLCEKLNLLSEVDPDMCLGDLELSTKAYKLLKGNGVSTLKDFVSISSEELLKINGLGRKTLSEIIEKRKDYVVFS